MMIVGLVSDMSRSKWLVFGGALLLNYPLVVYLAIVPAMLVYGIFIGAVSELRKFLVSIFWPAS